MKVVAPGKVLLFGAYSVLQGTPALVVAVDRFAVADTDRLSPSTSREVRAAIGDEPAPAIDVSALHDPAGGEKLGLGSSAAVLVATLGARAAMRGADLSDAAVRREIFVEARRAHAEAQHGGSGVDVAASTFGGALFYAMGSSNDATQPTDLPAGLELRVFWSGKSARTSDLRAAVDRLAAKDPGLSRRRIDAIGACVTTARNACLKNDLAGFVAAGRDNARALADLGASADAPIVPPSFADLASLAEREHAAFYPSGAGGGDVAVWLGADPPSAGFLDHARSLGMFLLDLGMDRAGVRLRKD